MSASRRDFLRWSTLAGAGVVLRVDLLASPKTAGAVLPFAPNQWLQITSDGDVTLVIARSEMGQGVRTSLAMILAEELEADWSRIHVTQAATDRDYGDMGTGGSDSVESSWMLLRRAAAAAREMLFEAAARSWKVDRSTCRAERGSVRHDPTGRKLTYGQLVPIAARLSVPKDPPLKDPKDFRIVGTGVRRIDGPHIVTGRAKYGLDTRVPNMVFAAIARCPVKGGKLRRLDASKAKTTPGVVRVVELEDSVAVVARDTWSALSGRDNLQIEWDEGPNGSLTTEELWRRIDGAVGNPGHVSRREGDVSAALAQAATRLSATYRDAFQAHGSVEPQNAIARVFPGGCEIWAPTQHPQRVRAAAAKLLGVANEKVKVNTTLIGGGFGRRLAADYATEAVEVAKKLGRPVQVVWSREDDFHHDRLHPAGRADIEAGLDASGKIVAWKHRFTSFHLSMFGPYDPNAVDETDVDPWGGYDTPYDIPNLQAEWLTLESPIHTGAWRSVEYPANVFARECFFDEIAHKTGRDPLDFRKELLSGSFQWAGRAVERAPLAAVVELAAAKAGWGTPLPQRPGRRSGRGIACNVYHGRTHLAHVADVSVGEKGDVRVHRIVTATDCGQVVNALGIGGQVESGVAWGLSYALKSEITVEKGRVVESSFRDFPVLGVDEMPQVEVYTVPSTKPPRGFGEQPVPPVAPAVANAIFAATGKRVRRVPIRPEDLV